MPASEVSLERTAGQSTAALTDLAVPAGQGIAIQLPASAIRLRLARFFGQVLAAGYLALFPLAGLIVAFIGFCDPDTCWHLALGRWMCEHQRLPISDPFSSNIRDFVSASAGPMLQHEWFSDCIFYSLYNAGGSVSLLVFTAVLSCFALVIAPALLLRRSGAPYVASVGLTLCLLPACLFRLWVRPELLSFGCMALLILLVCIVRRCSTKALITCLASAFALLSLWANLHALFVIGLFYLGLNAALALTPLFGGERIRINFSDEAPGGEFLRLTALAAAGVAGTLANPWGIRLWTYIMSIVSSPQAHANKENGPLDMNGLAHFTVIPLAVSFAVAGFCLWRNHTTTSNYSSGYSSTKWLALIRPIGLYIAALLVAVLFRRMTPFALLMLVGAVATSYQLAVPGVKASGTFVFSEAERLLQNLKLLGLSSASIGLVLTVSAVVYSSTVLVKPEIPARSRFFNPACQALAALDKSRPPGRMLNDSRLGSMMTFCMTQPPDLFIDGRFDFYSRSLIDDYQEMRMARPGCPALLRKYGIDWIIFPPGTPLVELLLQDPEWRLFYRDKAAIVLARVVGKN